MQEMNLQQLKELNGGGWAYDIGHKIGEFARDCVDTWSKMEHSAGTGVDAMQAGANYM